MDNTDNNNNHPYNTRSKDTKSYDNENIKIEHHYPTRLATKVTGNTINDIPLPKTNVPKRQVNVEPLSTNPDSPAKIVSKKNKSNSKQNPKNNIINAFSKNNLVTIIQLKNLKDIFNMNNNDDEEEYDDIEDNSEDDEIYDESDTEMSDAKEFDLPEDLFYTEEEEDYLSKLNETERQELYELERKIVKNKIEIPIRFKILKMNFNDSTKSNILKMIEQSTSSSDSEGSKINYWVEQLSKIPFDKYVKSNITRDNTAIEIQKYLTEARQKLDSVVFGHDTAKTQILSILSKEISNPSSLGNVFAIKGPMGNGKTTLIKEGICQVLNKPFGFIALGGMKDSSTLIGHDFTYVGSKPGRIAEILMECKCMNPVIYFDELDKVSSSDYGQEIINVLIHLTDPSQNKQFQDKYFSGIDFDLSKATLIFSYNNEFNINPILLDRMIKITTDEFRVDDKVNISQNYLLKNILQEYNFTNTDVVFTRDALVNIINNFTDKEQGVRNLKRCLDNVVSKLNILRYLTPTSTELTNVEKIKVEKYVNFKVKDFKLPYIVSNENLEYFLKKDEINLAYQNMFM